MCHEAGRGEEEKWGENYIELVYLMEKGKGKDSEGWGREMEGGKTQQRSGKNTKGHQLAPDRRSATLEY